MEERVDYLKHANLVYPINGRLLLMVVQANDEGNLQWETLLLFDILLAFLNCYPNKKSPTIKKINKLLQLNRKPVENINVKSYFTLAITLL